MTERQDYAKPVPNVAFFSERLGDIEGLLRAGYSKRHVFERFVELGFTGGYRTFCRLCEAAGFGGTPYERALPPRPPSSNTRAPRYRSERPSRAPGEPLRFIPREERGEE